MHLHSETAAPWQGNGGSVETKAVAAHFYPTQAETAIAIDDGTYAIAVISARFQLAPATAFEICRLAGLGVR
ncbi:hypothetical protein EOA79_04595 [Mesorhizobium sp. M1A.F.Ca.IN.020.03.2.1]|uniref:hypothetical protein n=1 Tax=Mesorhizobium sp. M1A.F.Ca.IN.020.03.2.1 TaxID=2496769 RepID=UPI000FD3E8F0|nr:hypothetical protein [Mesorhizobium sp. M1A.F.Ca.IN.020.03.2.1]RUV07449.1 hypothetical protein EOA79_04595 [Mesorhizobium sp. M1A.F.Ca.IN.020.03.2.1]